MADQAATCPHCGRTVRQWLARSFHGDAWLLDSHDAPCGAPCSGGSLRPQHRREGETLGDVLRRSHPRGCGCGDGGSHG